jgi:hypothetical protein
MVDDTKAAAKNPPMRVAVDGNGMSIALIFANS